MRQSRKLAMEFITKERSRKLTFEKRKRCLMKKAQELSILCGVDTCMIIYDDFGSSIHPEIWPPSHNEITRIINQFQIAKNQKLRANKSYGVCDYIQNRKKNLEKELHKARVLNLQAKYPVSDDVIDNFTRDELASLAAKLDQQLGIAEKKLAILKEGNVANERTALVALADNRNYYIDQNMCQEVNMPMWSELEFPVNSQFPAMLPYYEEDLNGQLHRSFEPEVVMQSSMSIQTNNDSNNGVRIPEGSRVAHDLAFGSSCGNELWSVIQQGMMMTTSQPGPWMNYDDCSTYMHG